MTWETAGGWSNLIKSGVLPGDVVGRSTHEQPCQTPCMPQAAAMVTLHETFAGGERKTAATSKIQHFPMHPLSKNRILAEKRSDSTFPNASTAFRCH